MWGNKVHFFMRIMLIIAVGVVISVALVTRFIFPTTNLGFSDRPNGLSNKVNIAKAENRDGQRAHQYKIVNEAQSLETFRSLDKNSANDKRSIKPIDLEYQKAIRFEKLKLLTHGFDLPNFPRIFSSESNSPLSASTLVSQYDGYLRKQKSFKELGVLAKKIGFNSPAIERIAHLEMMMSDFFKNEGVADITSDDQPSSISFVLEELIHNRYSEVHSDYETSSHLAQQTIAKELEVIGARFCHEISDFLVNDYLAI